jgi:16S rRNA (guanine527-N7)-methyltransferase
VEYDNLAPGLEILGLESRGIEAEQLVIYLRELEKWNPVFGLVGTGRKPQDESAFQNNLVIRHILDSLAGLSPIRRVLSGNPPSLADAGSGAGLPGIPLAVFLKETSVTLIEPSQRRCAFLRSAAALMKLKNVHVFEETLEAVRETFSLVTCRAFRPLDRKTIKALAAIVKPGGIIAAYKGTGKKAEKETAAARELGLRAYTELLPVPFLDEERCLVIISAFRES